MAAFATSIRTLSAICSCTVCSPSLRDLSVDAAGRDDAIVDLQALEELLHLLLLALHRQQDDEVEDRQDERERDELHPRAAAVGQRRPWRTRRPASQMDSHS